MTRPRWVNTGLVTKSSTGPADLQGNEAEPAAQVSGPVRHWGRRGWPDRAQEMPGSALLGGLGNRSAGWTWRLNHTRPDAT